MEALKKNDLDLIADQIKKQDLKITRVADLGLQLEVYFMSKSSDLRAVLVLAEAPSLFKGISFTTYKVVNNDIKNISLFERKISFRSKAFLLPFFKDIYENFEKLKSIKTRMSERECFFNYFKYDLLK